MEGFHTLMYHEIIKRVDWNADNVSNIKVKQNYTDILPKTLFVFLEEFEKQVDYLYKNGYITLKLENIVDFYYKGKGLPEKSVLITFDDMYKSVMIYAYPVLKKYSFNAVGFVVLDWLFDEPVQYSTEESICLSTEELSEMNDVFECANHSKALHTRKNGFTALQKVDRKTFIEDIKECELFTGSRGAFAYPFGIATDKIKEWLKELGFKLAFTTNGGFNTRLKDPMKLSREGILLSYDMDKFIDILE